MAFLNVECIEVGLSQTKKRNLKKLKFWKIVKVTFEKKFVFFKLNSSFF
jgi:hypothetical protein